MAKERKGPRKCFCRQHANPEVIPYATWQKHFKQMEAERYRQNQRESQSSRTRRELSRLQRTQDTGPAQELPAQIDAIRPATVQNESIQSNIEQFSQLILNGCDDHGNDDDIDDVNGDDDVSERRSNGGLSPKDGDRESTASCSDDNEEALSSEDNDDCAFYTNFSAEELSDPDTWQFPDQVTEDVVNNLIWKLDNHVTDIAYESAPLYVGENQQQANPSLHIAKKIIRQLTRIRSRLIPCCINSCAAFSSDTDDNRTENCPDCGKAIYETKYSRRSAPVIRPRQHYLYMSPIPRLILEFAQEELAKELVNYRRTMEQFHSPGVFRDYFDGQHFRQCKDKGLFKDIRDLALSILTNGVNITRQRTQTVWPITCTILNYPPEIRYKRMMLLGLTPGPHEPKDLGSFFKPLLEDLDKLAAGVRCFDAFNKAIFDLRAHVCVVTGDTPAIAKMMDMKGANSLLPCRFCYIRGERNTSRNGSKNYFPLKARRIGKDIKL